MEGSDGSPPQSLCMIRAAELFPKSQMEKEDSQLTVPYQELAGESVKYLGRTDDGVLALSNYRIFLLKNSNNSETSVPLQLIESIQGRDLFHLIINCKDASTIKCSFETAEQCSEWQRRLQLSIGVPETLETLFAFPFCSWTCDGAIAAAINGSGGGGGGIGGLENGTTNYNMIQQPPPEFFERFQRASRTEDDFMREVERLGFDLNGSWRISNANEDFKLCPSYPKKILVPCCISDETLQNVANFRGSRRLPAVVWRHRASGAVIARCSQPEVGWLGWRSSKDEQLLKALADACAFDRGEQMRRLQQLNTGQQDLSAESTPSSPEGSHEEVALDEVRKILIVDARSYTSAVTNRARGGGCECIEYYPCAEIEFMNLGNIHVIRKSFHALRQLCAQSPDTPNWLSLLEKTMWLQHISGLIAASMTVCHAIEKKGRPVLVHCSDGWDRTPQIVATAQICLDPYYRTVEGFRVLVEREWLSYGHKFSDRCGHGPGSDEVNERCPVFLQWLDLIHQIHEQFPCSFEFNMGYLIKLAQHSLSCLFGTFLCNTLKERVENSVFERTFSVWPFLSGSMYRNPLYVPNKMKVLWPAHNVRDLHLWRDVYLGSLGNQNSIEFSTCNPDGLYESISPMTKTRSYGDLITAGIMQNGISRRSSDPNMTVDPNLTICSNSESESIPDTQSGREDSPDIYANLFHDTTKKLQNLTIELNNHDEDNFQILQTGKQENLNNTSIENDDETMHKLMQHQKQMQNLYQNQINVGGAGGTVGTTATAAVTFTTNNEIKTIDLSSSPLSILNYASHLNENHNINQNVSCEVNESSCGGAPYKSVTCDVSAAIIDTNDVTKMHTNPMIEQLISHDNKKKIDNFKNNVNSDMMMHSIDLNSSPTNFPITFVNGISVDSQQLDQQDDLWHGSVNTSTDTLVPIEFNAQQHNIPIIKNDMEQLLDITDGGCTNTNDTVRTYAATIIDNKKADFKSTANSGINDSNSILPKVHTTTTNNRPNNLSTSPINAFNNMSLPSLNNSNTILNYINGTTTPTAASTTTTTTTATTNQINGICDNKNNFTPSSSPQSNAMDESILILPEHQKLEISISGKCETIPSNSNVINTQKLATINTTASQQSYNGAGGGGGATNISATAQRRRRTSSTNSRRDNLFIKQSNGSTTFSRYSLPAVRSLPLTPPGLPERSQIPITCPDGLAHALSEQNIRLLQIVHEDKLREDKLIRELHEMRLALLNKKCLNCNTATTIQNEEQCSVLDNGENVSICSWEAVEDRSGPPSSTSSSIQPNTTSVLWVPDHAVSRCTSCQTEFWLGRRKHHCRSCGQIFCADCSEFWAPLPDLKLFSPVRLCGPCYHSVTTRMQQQQQQQQQNAPAPQSRSLIIAPTNQSNTTTINYNSNISSNSNNSAVTNCLTNSVPVLQQHTRYIDYIASSLSTTPSPPTLLQLPLPSPSPSPTTTNHIQNSDGIDANESSSSTYTMAKPHNNNSNSNSNTNNNMMMRNNSTDAIAAATLEAYNHAAVVASTTHQRTTAMNVTTAATN